MTALVTETLSDRACTHCGLPVPAALLVRDATRQFCCRGCASVYDLLQAHQLGDYYALREELDQPGSAGAGSGLNRLGRGSLERSEARFSGLDDETVQASHVQVLADGRRRVELFVQGIHCAACVWLLERLPRLVPGLSQVRVQLERNIASVSWDPERIALSEIAAHFDQLGYTPALFKEGLQTEVYRLEDRRALARIGVAGAATGNVMLLAFALYAGEGESMSPDQATLMRWLSMTIAVPAILWSGQTFFSGAGAALKTRTPHMDLPIAIGILASLLWGSFNTLRGAGHIYFDSATALVFLLLIGRYVQQRQHRRAQASTQRLYSLVPSQTLRRESDGSFHQVPTDKVQSGDVLAVKSGERIPVDGVVIRGSSSVDTSWLTGESALVAVRADSKVPAGAANLGGELLISARATGDETRIARVVASVREAAAHKAPIVVLADRVSAWFVLAVLGLAVLCFIGWSFVSLELAVQNAVTLLIVSCPCALGLATPLTTAVALAGAANRGILIKGAEYLELLARDGQFVFDKTGTLTTGKLSVVEWQGPDRLKAWVVAVERESAHPVAKALRAALPDDPELACEQFRETLGYGVQAVLRGEQVTVGSVGFIQTLGFELGVELRETCKQLEQRALSPVLVVLDGEVQALAAVGDPIREDAASSLEWLSRAGHCLHLLSGDRLGVVNAVADALKARFAQRLGEVSPEEKLAEVRRLRERGAVFMVGDGVNDAAALAAASVGIAVSGGAEVSMDAADVYMGNPGVAPLVQLVRGARQTMRTIRITLGLSLGYNIVVAGLAVAGLLTPLIAAVLMPLSSIAVVTLALRARSFGDS